MHMRTHPFLQPSQHFPQLDRPLVLDHRLHSSPFFARVNLHKRQPALGVHFAVPIPVPPATCARNRQCRPKRAEIVPVAEQFRRRTKKLNDVASPPDAADGHRKEVVVALELRKGGREGDLNRRAGQGEGRLHEADLSLFAGGVWENKDGGRARRESEKGLKKTDSRLPRASRGCQKEMMWLHSEGEQAHRRHVRRLSSRTLFRFLSL
eukprot:4077962-Pleurochrysis_carterae.AAC.1